MAKCMLICNICFTILQVCVTLSPLETLQLLRNKKLLRQEEEKNPTSIPPTMTVSATETIHLPGVGMKNPTTTEHTIHARTDSEETSRVATSHTQPLYTYPSIAFTSTSATKDEHISYPADCNNCTKVYDPVCASNHQSYYNPCKMYCGNLMHNLTILYLGKCIPF